MYMFLCKYVCTYIKVFSICPKGDIQAEYMLIDKNSDHEADKQVCMHVEMLLIVTCSPFNVDILLPMTDSSRYTAMSSIL